MTEIIGSGLAFPLQVDRRGGIALARDEQDIDQAIQLILGTAPGRAPDAPGVRLRRARLRVRLDRRQHDRAAWRRRSASALERWEPRIEVQSTSTSTSSQAGSGLLTIDIGYKVRATNTERNLVYPFYVIPAEEME